MTTILTALKLLGISLLILISVFLWLMTVYILKQIKWESNLKSYRTDDQIVVNPQGFRLETPKELLEDLQGIEERIAK